MKTKTLTIAVAVIGIGRATALQFARKVYKLALTIWGQDVLLISGSLMAIVPTGTLLSKRAYPIV